MHRATVLGTLASERLLDALVFSSILIAAIAFKAPLAGLNWFSTAFILFIAVGAFAAVVLSRSLAQPGFRPRVPLLAQDSWLMELLRAFSAGLAALRAPRLLAKTTLASAPGVA